MFNAKPVRTVDGIFDFLGDTEDDFVLNYERISKEYYQHREPLAELQAISNCCELLIQNNIYEMDAVLDVGCGAGYILDRVHALGKVGLDISLEQLKRVDKYVIRVRANAEEMPFEDNMFNAVICVDVFEHVRDEKALARELYRVIKPKGLLLFACPWEQDLSVYDSERYEKKFKYVHLRSINEKMMKENFSGFQIMASTYVTVGMRDMELKPYPVRFFQFKEDSK